MSDNKDFYWFGFIWRVMILCVFVVCLVALIAPSLGISDHVYDIVKHLVTEIATNNL